MERWAKALEIKDAARVVRRAEDDRAIREGLADASVTSSVLNVAVNVRSAGPRGEDRADVIPFRMDICWSLQMDQAERPAGRKQHWLCWRRFAT
jgi:hypothetical protein